ncbi:MAG: hypothetical protein JXA60_06235 [Candidatus Coatesbacteria bacterium]|nr:hypothetical protein [Candidatus Coatesbacteria bacterium]
MACMRICPTSAIRIRRGKAALVSERCIDCGLCLQVCTHKAIVPKTDAFSTLPRFSYKVAIPSSAIYGHFGSEISPICVQEGLIQLGFNEVFDISTALEYYVYSIERWLSENRSLRPVILSVCPTVVRLIQVLFPSLVEHVLPLQPPREFIAMLAKVTISERLGVKPEEISCFFIAPCSAIMISIKQPAEGSRSSLDGTIGIQDIYNHLYSKVFEISKEHTLSEPISPISGLGISFGYVGGLLRILAKERWLAVAGLSNLIRIFQEIESGRLRGVEFIECWSSPLGCCGGSLTVESSYINRSRLIDLSNRFPQRLEIDLDAAKKYYDDKISFLHGKLLPRPLKPLDTNILRAVKKMKKRDEFLKLLPKFNCGLCGCPTCSTFAEEVASGQEDKESCVFFSPNRLRKLINLYNIDFSSLSEDEEEEAF